MPSEKRTLKLALLLAALLTAPSALLTRFGDDLAQQLAIEGSTTPYKGLFTPGDLFVFSDGNPAHVRAMVEQGVMPWWAHPSLKIAFFRPLSSALMRLDNALFGRGNVGPHLHSALWYLALIAAAALLLRRALPPAVAGWALLLYAIDDTHSLPVMWLANRNALVAAAFGFLGVYFHLRAREDRLRWASAASVLLFGVALLAGEVALGAIAYVAAYELTRDDERLSARALALAPVTLLTATWALAYKLLGYGASGALMYIDPLAQPGDWLVAALSRGPVLVGALFPGLWAEVWNATPPGGRPVLVAVSIGASALFFLGAWRVSRALEPSLRRRVRWLTLGSLLSVLPVTATFPSGRLLVVPSLGAAVAVVVAIQHAWRARGRSFGGVAAAAAAAVLVFLHVVLALPQWAFTGALMHFAGQKSDRMSRSVLAALGPARLPELRLITLWSDPLSALNAGARLALETGSAPKSWWLVSMAAGDHVFTRSGPAALEVELAAEDKRLLASEAERFLRAPPMPMPQSQSLPGMRVEVTEQDAMGIKRLRFTFDAPLEDPSLLFLHWNGRELERLTPPSVGTRWVEKEPPLL